MIFRPQLARMVREGRKTQTRRLVDDRQPCRYSPGRVYPVQPGRGKRAIARVQVVDVARQQLGEITERAARAEGFTGRGQFFAYWRIIHRLGLRQELRDVLERVVDAPGPLGAEQLHPGLARTTVRWRLRDLRDRGLLEQLDDGRWEITNDGAELLTDELEGIDLETPVWAITFQLAAVAVEVPVFLTHSVSASGVLQEGYTTRRDRAMVGEPEVMDPDKLSLAWRAVSTGRHHDACHGGDFGERLTRARAIARQRGVDLSNLEDALRERFERVVGAEPDRLAAVINTRLTAIERKARRAA